MSNQCFRNAAVSTTIPTALREPIRAIGRRDALSASALMSVPKAAIDEDDFAEPRKDQIGASRQIGAMKAKTVTELMRNVPYHKFRCGVLSFDVRHNGASLICRDSIHGSLRELIGNIIRHRPHDEAGDVLIFVQVLSR